MWEIPDDFIHVDQTAETVLENWWLEVKELISYIKDRASRDLKFCRELHAAFKKLRWKDLMIKALMHKVGEEDEKDSK